MPLRVPPPEVPIVKWLSPNKADQGLLEFWNTELASYVPLDTGAAHPNTRLYPGFTLGKQMPMQGDEKWVMRIWVTPETSPEWFNYALKYSAEDTDYPIFIRTYRIAKVAYVPRAKGSTLGKLYKLAMTDPGSGYAVGTSPAVKFSDPAVAPTLVATAHGVVSPDGTISECVLDFDGSGYSENVAFTVEDPVNGNPASGIAYAQPNSAVLVKEEANQYPEDSEFYAQYLQVVRVYETLPGPVLTSVEFERDGVKKVSTKQRVQVGTEITHEELVSPNLLVRQYYEAIDSVVSNQITESINVDSDSLLDKPELTTSIRNLIPDVFLGQIPLFTNSHIVEGEPAQPPLDLGEFEHSEKSLSPLYKEVRSTVLSDVAIPIVITGIKETNDKKQVVSITMTLEADSTTPTLPTATRDVDFKKLGNGLAIEVVRTVPNVFPEDSYTTSILNLIPEKFRAAIPLKESTIDSAGSPSTDPTLLTGEFSRTEGRLTEFTKRVRITSLGTVSLPVVITGNKETDKDKQVVSVTYTLEADSTTPTAPTATRDVEFTKLGNGLAVETVRTVPEVFPEDSYTKSILNLIPERLRAAIPITESTIDSAGSPSTNPTLLTGELSRTEGRITEFTKRVKITSLGVISPPVSVVDYGVTSKFGGNTTTTTSTLDTHGSMSVDTGLMVVDSKLTDLGNGYDVKETEVGDGAAWPTITDTIWDKEMQVEAFEEHQVVDPAYTITTGTYFVETLKAIDEWKSERTKHTRTPTAVDLASALVEEVDGPFQFPGLIYAVTGGYYRRQASAQLCQQVLRTWWMSSSTKPTRGLPGSGDDVEVQDIVMDDIIISTLNNTSVLAYSGMCLHDAITTFGTFVYAATVPSATDYEAMIGTEITVDASIEPTNIPELWRIQTKSVVAR